MSGIYEVGYGKDDVWHTLSFTTKTEAIIHARKLFRSRKYHTVSVDIASPMGDSVNIYFREH